MRVPIFCFVFLYVTSSAFAGEGSEPAWPQVREVEAVMTFDYKSERYDLVLPIRSVDGEELYRLVCRGGMDRHMDHLSDKTGNTYVGPLTCVLNESGMHVETSLLSEGALYSKPWQTRGRFSPATFHTQACADHPTYGRLRRFRLRGFELTLEISEPDSDIEDEVLDDYSLSVSVKRDPTAKTRLSEPNGYLFPERFGARCEKVEKGLDDAVDPEVLLSAPEKFLGMRAGVVGFLQAGVPMKVYQGQDLKEAPPPRLQRQFLVIEDKDGAIVNSVCINMQVYIEATFAQFDDGAYGLSDIGRIVLGNNRACWWKPS